jgi:hypothetical protein
MHCFMVWICGILKRVFLYIYELERHWCKRYAKERGMSLSQVVEKQLIELYKENNGTFLAPGDHTPPDLMK